jgi:hypothetical protein
MKTGLVIMLSLISLAFGVCSSHAELTYSVSTNQSVFTTGDSQTLSVSIDNTGGTEVTVDVYVALLLPDGTLLFIEYDVNTGLSTFNPGTVDNPDSWTPAVENLFITADFVLADFPLLTYDFTGLEPLGQYTWFIAFFQPGTRNLDSIAAPDSTGGAQPDPFHAGTSLTDILKTPGAEADLVGSLGSSAFIFNPVVAKFLGHWSGTWTDTVFNVSGTMEVWISRDGDTFTVTGTIGLSELSLGSSSGTAEVSFIGNLITFTFSDAVLGSGSGTINGNTISGVDTTSLFGPFTFSGSISEDGNTISGQFTFTDPGTGAGVVELTKIP